MADITGPDGLVQKIIKDAVEQVLGRRSSRNVPSLKRGWSPQVISMYAKGMTVRDIAAHLQALYGIELSTASISNITDKVSDEAKEWYSRTLESFYPVVFLDAIRTIFPETRIQLCIIHQIRNTLKYVAYKDQKAFMRDLKRVYGAESEEIAMQNLERMMDDWKQ